MKAIRIKVKVKPEYAEDMKRVIVDRGEWSECKSSALKTFAARTLSWSVPFCVESYMEPTTWYDKSKNETDSFKTSFNEDSLILTIQCSSKNKEDQLDYFIEDVLTHIIDESYHIEVYNGLRETNTSDLFEYRDNEIVSLGYGIAYPLFDDEYDEYEFIEGSVKYHDFKEALGKLEEIV